MTTVKVKDKNGHVIEERIDDLQQNSIKISINAKGGVAVDVKVYEDDPKTMNDKLEQYLRIADAYKEGYREDK